MYDWAQKLMIKWKEKVSYSCYETSYISPYKEIFWQGSAVSTNVIHPSYTCLTLNIPRGGPLRTPEGDFL